MYHIFIGKNSVLMPKRLTALKLSRHCPKVMPALVFKNLHPTRRFHELPCSFERDKTMESLSCSKKMSLSSLPAAGRQGAGIG